MIILLKPPTLVVLVRQDNPGGVFYMSKQKRIAVYIDGGNLYHKLKSLKVPNTLKFDYAGFCKLLARENDLVAMRYYVGVIKAKGNNSKSQILRINQRKLFNYLKPNFKIKKGYLMQNDGQYHEKGVDVQLAVDLLIGAYENFYDRAIVVSSDTDLIPAMQKVKKLGKEIEYIGFSHQPSRALFSYVNFSRLLQIEDLEPFISKNT